MAKPGYLAAIYKSKPVTVGASDIHSLLTNGDFETGDLTGWTEDNGGASTTTVTALKGYKEASYGVVFVDDGTGAKIHQTKTLDTAIGAATFTGVGLDDLTPGGTYTGVMPATYKIEIDATGTPDTFKLLIDDVVISEGVSITGAAQDLTNGITGTFGATTGHTLGEYWTLTAERLRALAYVWAKLPTTKSASLKIDLLNASDVSLGSSTKTILANNPFYGDAVWGYWSTYLAVPILTKKVKVEIYSAAAQTWYADLSGVLIGEQVVGAYALDLREGKAAIETTTFKSAQDDGGARQYIVGLERVEFSSDTIWQGSEAYDELQDEDTVFVQVFYEEGSVKDREEFWAKMISKSYGADSEDAEKKAIELLATSHVGMIAG